MQEDKRLTQQRQLEIEETLQQMERMAGSLLPTNNCHLQQEFDQFSHNMNEVSSITCMYVIRTTLHHFSVHMKLCIMHSSEWVVNEFDYIYGTCTGEDKGT